MTTGAGVYRRRAWGPWVLDRENYVLFYPSDGNETEDHSDGFRYYVALEQCTTSARVLDRVAQIAGKNWADDTTLAGLVRAVDDVLYLQGNLCSFGNSHTLDKSTIRGFVAGAR